MKQEPRPYGMEDDLEDDFSVMSATECTGLIPTPPLDDAQADSYGEIYDVPISKEKTNGHVQSIQKSRRDIASQDQDPT